MLDERLKSISHVCTLFVKIGKNGEIQCFMIVHQPGYKSVSKSNRALKL